MSIYFVITMAKDGPAVSEPLQSTAAALGYLCREFAKETTLSVRIVEGSVDGLEVCHCERECK
jgi:hypothetical protein